MYLRQGRRSWVGVYGLGSDAQRPGALNHAANRGAWAVAPLAQLSIRSSDCRSVRSASGTWCSAKNVLTSAAVDAAQNDESALTMVVLPTNSPVFFRISFQRSRTSCQASV